MYRCEAVSIAGFIQQLAVSYIANGYWFYVTGNIPSEKDVSKVDEKIIRQYDIDISKWTRRRRRLVGRAAVQYLRYGRFFVIVATHGRHPFFELESGQIRDVRRQPIRFGGYAIGCGRGQGKWHPSVRIDLDTYMRLRHFALASALNCHYESLLSDLGALRFEPYAPVRRQLWRILKAINWKRRSTGIEPVENWPFRRGRRSLLPFGVGSGPAGRNDPQKRVTVVASEQDRASDQGTVTSTNI